MRRLRLARSSQLRGLTARPLRRRLAEILGPTLIVVTGIALLVGPGRGGVDRDRSGITDQQVSGPEPAPETEPSTPFPDAGLSGPAGSEPTSAPWMVPVDG